MKQQDKRNRICFGLGTVGRDMLYAFEANTVLYFLSDVLSLQVWEFAAASMILSVLRIFDACNDPTSPASKADTLPLSHLGNPYLMLFDPIHVSSFYSSWTDLVTPLNFHSNL